MENEFEPRMLTEEELKTVGGAGLGSAAYEAAPEPLRGLLERIDDLLPDL